MDWGNMDWGNIIGSGIGGLFNVFGTAAANKQQAKIANAQNKLQWAMHQSTQNWNERMARTMFNLENAYNSPLEQMKRLNEAGINPSVAMAGSLGSAQSTPGDVATPQMASSPTAVGPSYENPFRNLSSDFAQIASGIAQLATAKKTGVDTEYMRNAMQDMLRSVKAKAQTDESNAAIQKYEEEASRMYTLLERRQKYKSLLKEYDLLNQNWLNAMATEENINADTLLKDAQRFLAEAQKKMSEQDYKQAVEMMPILVNNAKLAGELTEAEIDTESTKQELNKTGAEANRASADESRANAGRLDEETRRLRLENGLLKLRNQALNYRDKNGKLVFRKAYLDNLLDSWEHQHLINDIERQRLGIAIKDNDWYTVKSIIGIAKDASETWNNFPGYGDNSVPPDRTETTTFGKNPDGTKQFVKTVKMTPKSGQRGRRRRR